MDEFHRIRRLPPYVFEQVNRVKAQARNAGADIIDLGMGNPDLPTPAHVIEKLKETLGKPRTDRYSASQGHPGLRRAQAAYYARRFGVKLNPDTQVVATLGSKEGFANVAQAITAPGDVVLVPNPSYPIHAFGFLMAGGVIRSVPSEPTPEFFPALERAMQHSIPKPLARRRLLSGESDRLCRRPRFLSGPRRRSRRSTACSSSPTSPTPRSISTTIRRLRCCRCRARSMSPSSSPRCRRPSRCRAGASALRSATSASSRRSARVKSYLDYGAFTPIQVAATAALNGPDDCIREMRETYKRRRDALVDSFGRAGWQIPPPRASMFAWAPIPEPFRPLGSLEFSKLLVEKARVAVSPGIGFGEHGEGYVRIALVENEQRIRQAARNIRRFLESGAEKLHNVVPLATRR